MWHSQLQRNQSRDILKLPSTMPSEQTTPLVSICCLAFNQKEYIGKAIDSMLMQQTSFTTEIIIHDDASTDGTDQIIKQYAELHPNQITAFFESTLREQQSIHVWIQWAYGLNISLSPCERKIHSLLRRRRLLDRPSQITKTGRLHGISSRLFRMLPPLVKPQHG